MAWSRENSRACSAFLPVSVSREPGLKFSLWTNWPHLGRCPTSTLTCPRPCGSLQKWSLMVQDFFVLILRKSSCNNDLLSAPYRQSNWLGIWGTRVGNKSHPREKPNQEVDHTRSPLGPPLLCTRAARGDSFQEARIPRVGSGVGVERKRGQSRVWPYHMGPWHQCKTSRSAR